MDADANANANANANVGGSTIALRELRSGELKRDHQVHATFLKQNDFYTPCARWHVFLFSIYVNKTSAECYSVLCPFLTKMSIIYRWNQYQMFYLQSSLDVAYHISMRIYKLFNLASLPKNDFTLVLYCSMSILNQ